MCYNNRLYTLNALPITACILHGHWYYRNGTMESNNTITLVHMCYCTTPVTKVLQELISMQ